MSVRIPGLPACTEATAESKPHRATDDPSASASLGWIPEAELRLSLSQRRNEPLVSVPEEGEWVFAQLVCLLFISLLHVLPSPMMTIFVPG